MTTVPNWIAGNPCLTDLRQPVRFPFTGETVGEVCHLGREHIDGLVEAMLAGNGMPRRHDRYAVLEKARGLLEQRVEEFALSIVMESGLALREARYEVGRALDVLQFAAIESIQDDGKVLCGDVSASGSARRIFTLRQSHR
ncbi:MAG: aldehyde dehydrogenase family protein, partial [Armatimonadaceae bacterium]